MEVLSEALPIVIYLLLIVLLVVAIIIGIRLILTMNKVDDILEDLSSKAKSLDKLFNIIDFATDRVSMVSDTVINFVSGAFSKIFKKRNTKKVKVDDDE